MASGAVAVGLLLAGLAGSALLASGALAETIRDVQIGDTVIAYDADRFQMTSRGTHRLDVGCKSESCWPGIGIAAERYACGDPSSPEPPVERSARRTSASSLFSNGLEFQLIERHNGCRNWVASSVYACVQVGASAIRFSQIVIGCGHGPVAQPSMTEFLTAIRLRPAGAR